ncbi:MAG: hypothetical protein N2319_04175 [Candidatus Kapabacteria bacterium]|nr:hypothetical protein [Candidatus Kapabacteria bacterium]
MTKKLFLIVIAGRTDNPSCATKYILHLLGVGHLKNSIFVTLNEVKSPSIFNDLCYMDSSPSAQKDWFLDNLELSEEESSKYKKAT